MPNATPIRLTTSDYPRQIDALVRAGEIEEKIGGTLKAVVGAHVACEMPASASPNEIESAKRCIGIRPICLADSATEREFNLAAFVPDASGETRWTFLRLIPHYAQGRMRLLDEL